MKIIGKILGAVLSFGCMLAACLAADTTINRRIDVSKTYRDFPHLADYRNTSLQKTPAPALAILAEREFGKPQIVRCWLNLDELWDYRSRKFDFNFQVGVDKYKGIPEKHRETWDSEVLSPLHYEDYLGAFAEHSEQLMLTIRRYERDILNKALPITMDDWKMIFKTGLKHYKEKYPNIRYVEVANEYELQGFMGATDEEYYEFYKRGYEAVNEVNEELGLRGHKRILVGGPVVTTHLNQRIGHFAQFFSHDTNLKKRVDFISWHEYTVPVIQTSFREKEIRNLLKQNGLNETLPLFITEHNAYHFKADSTGRNLVNAAGLMRTLYYPGLYSPNMRIFPWVLYHDAHIQTRFMWFTGANEPTTQPDELKMLPIGIAMKLLAMHRGKEIWVENTMDGPDLVIASASTDSIRLQAVNYGEAKPVQLLLQNLPKEWSGKKLSIRQYLLDTKHNNVLGDPAFKGRLAVSGQTELTYEPGKALTLRLNMLEKDAIVFWEITNN